MAPGKDAGGNEVCEANPVGVLFASRGGDEGGVGVAVGGGAPMIHAMVRLANIAASGFAAASSGSRALLAINISWQQSVSALATAATA